MDISSPNADGLEVVCRTVAERLLRNYPKYTSDDLNEVIEEKRFPDNGLGEVFATYRYLQWICGLRSDRPELPAELHQQMIKMLPSVCDALEVELSQYVLERLGMPGLHEATAPQAA